MRIAPEVQVPRARNQRTTYLEAGLELVNPMRPWFRFGQLTNNTLYVQGRPTNCGDSPLLIPFRFANADYTKRLPIIMSIPTAWTIDLNATTIDLTTYIGGIVDGVALTAGQDYFVWAFADEYRNLKGFGITARPRIVDGRTSSGGGLGDAGSVFTVSSGHGWRFGIGSRVIIRKGTGLAPGNEYNQGTVVAHESAKITVDLDALYTDVTIESNVSLIGLTGLEIFQTDNFSPRMYNQNSLYPGSGIEYQYSYIGSIQTNDTFDIRHVRQLGDWYMLPVESYLICTHVTTVTMMHDVTLARWIPVGTGQIAGILTIEGTNVLAFMKVQTDSVAGLGGITSSRITGGGVSRVGYSVLIRLHNAAVHYHLNTTAASTMTGTAYLTSYKAETF